jgi:hypothetical protein
MWVVVSTQEIEVGHGYLPVHQQLSLTNCCLLVAAASCFYQRYSSILQEVKRLSTCPPKKRFMYLIFLPLSENLVASTDLLPIIEIFKMLHILIV